MIFYQKIGGESYFIDSVTHNSFMLFIILREYICSLTMPDNSEDQIPCINSKDTITLYMLMYEMLKENIGNPFDILKRDSQDVRIPAYLKPLIRGRIERLRNYYEAVAYTNLSTFKNLVFAKSSNVGNEIDDDDDENSGDGGGDANQNSNRRFFLTKDSVFGLFLRKFSLGIYSQSFEKLIQFFDSFFDAYDNELCSRSNSNIEDLIVQNFAHSFIRDQYLISTRNQALDICSEIIDSIGKIGGRPNLNLQKYNELLLLAKKMYPEVSYTHYASHAYALQKRNLTMAENELHAYFETCMASVQNPEISLTTSTFSGAGTASTTTTTTTAGPGTSASSVLTPPINSSNTCAHMAVTGAAMHLNFGHWYKGKCLIKEALQKSLESESKDSLGHVKVTHTLLNSSADPFRYDNEVPMKQSFKSNDVTLTEFRTKFWSALDTGSEPYKLLTVYFNSVNIISQAYFTVCQLDLATMWQFYGYPNMATVLMQCIISADCLEPCRHSDTILANAFANIIKEFNSMGSIETALKLSKICRSTLCRFPNQSPLLQASMEVELEQHLRSGYDLAQCDRLVNSLKLYCPWESAIRQAEVEQKRGNVSYTHDILRYIIDSIIARRDHDCGLLQQSTKNNHNNQLLQSNELWSQTNPFSHLILPTFPEHTPVGGLCRLALVELRAHLALIELLITLKLYVYAFNEIDITLKLCKRYRLSLGIEMIKLLQCAIHLSMNNKMAINDDNNNNPNDKNTKIDHIHTNNDVDPSSIWIHGLKQANPSVIFELNASLEEILHRTDQLTKFRCQVFLSRTRLLMDTNENNHSFIQMHMTELLKALNYYRQLDDRKRVLDILVLMAAALNSVNEYVKRNEVSKSFHILREHFGFKSLPSNRYVVDIL
uniref:Anaphase-promoting complex subunit 5 n=1 Tax=Schistosoma mansoni TaxID=6183 RepID=A0A5K4F861_SCHMA